MKACLILAASVLLVTCAPAPPAPPLPLVGGEPVDTICFPSGLSGFSEISDDALLLRRSPGEAYVVRVGFCPNAKSAEGLKIVDPGQCLQRGSRLLVYDTPLPLKGNVADRPDRCLVTQIFKARPAPSR